MSEIYAKEFSEIPQTLLLNKVLCNSVIKLIAEQPMAGKVTEGSRRLDQFREVLKSFALGKIDLLEATRRTIDEIPRNQSIYSGNNRVFASGWAERLVRTQYSRFYNQAILQQLISEGQVECFIHHSSQEDSTSNCSRYLAGRAHDPHILFTRLISAYENGLWSKDLKLPDHPHCSHVAAPVE
jgi:hypothetical protein